jgi:TRAP-type C4-dicarboxylate transport system substrate-binding protein
MKMFRKFCMVWFALIVIASLSAGGSGESSSAADKSVTLKFNCVKPSTDVQYEWYGRYFKEVEAATGGVIQTQLYPAEALGKAVDVLEQASQGESVIAHVDVGHLANYIPDFSMLMVPYLMQSPNEVLVLWNSDIAKDLCTQLEGKGLHYMLMGYEGTRSMITKVPVKTRADVNRLKLRCAVAPLWNFLVRVLGGNPTNIAMSETYQALSQGVADGAEGIFASMYTNKWYEVLKYVTKTEHMIGYTSIVMSSKIHSGLSADVRAALSKVSENYMDEFVRLADEVEQQYVEELKKGGVTFAEIDKTEFIEAAKKAPEAFPEWTPGLYDKLLAAMAAARGK